MNKSILLLGLALSALELASCSSEHNIMEAVQLSDITANTHQILLLMKG